MTNWPLQKDCLSFYGDPRGHSWLHHNTVDIFCPWPLHMGGVTVSKILIHQKCAKSLARILANVWDAVGRDVGKINQFHYDRFDGSYNLRVMRGGKALSMHSFACAIDWDAADNAFHAVKHLFTDASPLVVEFKKEGWIWGGDWSPGSQDAMHVQAARIHG